LVRFCKLKKKKAQFKARKVASGFLKKTFLCFLKQRALRGNTHPLARWWVQAARLGLGQQHRGQSTATWLC